MAKRFTDSDKWDRPWFRKLPSAYKLFWNFICDKCDVAGIWYVDMELASFMIGDAVDYQTAVSLFSKQIQVLNGGSRWHIFDFIPFQYGVLKDTNNFHLSIKRRLFDSGVKTPHKDPISGVQEKEKDKESLSLKSFKDKSLKYTSNLSFSDFWSAYPRKVGKGDAEKAWKKAMDDNPLLTLNQILMAIKKQKKTDQWLKDSGQYIPHPSTWLNQRRWEDEAELTNGKKEHDIYDTILSR